MHSTVPVPSKSALRALRNLALGTSFTVSFSTAVLTEDRRRRIQAAREVNGNGKKLKSSNNYNTATSLAVFDSFEGLLSTRRDGSVMHEPRDAKVKVSGSAKSGSSQSPTHPSYPPQAQVPVVRRVKYTDWGYTRQFAKLGEAGKKAKPSNWDVLSLQEGYDLDVSWFSEDGGAVSTTSGAAAKAVSTQEDLVAVSAFTDTGNSTFDSESSGMMPETALQYELTNQGSPYLPLTYSTVRQLIRTPSCSAAKQLDERHHGTTRKDLSCAASLYLKMSSGPQPPNSTAEELGELLCRKLCYWDMPNLALDIYRYLNAHRVGKPPIAGDCYIAAHHALCNHRAVVEYFVSTYRFQGRQAMFYNVGKVVFESAIAAGMTCDAMEKFLIAAFRTTEEHGLRPSTSWALRVMSCEWNTNHDVGRLTALFERMQPYFHLMGHAIAMQALLIQYCIEAGQEDVATAYYSEFEKLDPDIRNSIPIIGNFALGKAMRSDWIGVDESFGKMHQLKPDANEFSEKFLPVLNTFAKSHSVSETENFLSDFVDRYDLRLTNFIQTSMIVLYGKEREVEALARWIQYCATVGCSTNAASLRSILNSADKFWGFSFDETLKLYHSIREMEFGRRICVDEETVALLRRIAIYQAKNNPQQALRNLRRIDGDCFAPAKLTSRGVQSSMSTALHLGTPIRTLEIYKIAQKHKVQRHYSHLALAVTASLRLHKACVEETTLLIREAAKGGVEISPALVSLLTFQMSKLDINSSHDADKLVRSVTDAISALDKEGIVISTPIVTHAAHILERDGYPRHAVQFWKSMAHRAGLTPETLDIAILTVLLRAYIAIRSSDGISWVMGILMTNRLKADKKLKLVLRSAWKGVKKLVGGAHLPTEILEYCKAVTQAHEQIKMLRERADEEKEYLKHKAFEIADQAVSGKVSIN